MSNIFYQLKNNIIVSCQARGKSPFNSPEGVTYFAKAAALGGAAGIRSEGIAKTKMIIENVKLPVIGLVKSEFEDGFVRITGSFRDVEDLLSIGTHIIAIDGTFRKREGLTGPEFINKVKERYNCTILADVARYEEGEACVEAGCDSVSTTLSGYTPETVSIKGKGPDFDVLEQLARKFTIPVFAEGRINTPDDAARMIQLGAWGVIVGTAITAPDAVTKWYIEAIQCAAK
ncbi:MAG: N-acetylmannosamine-6-phosphate 2-epimerase [Bacillota bacterium]